MASVDKANIFRGVKNVAPPGSTVTNNQEQSNSAAMTSTTANNNSTTPAFNFSTSTAGPTSQLASLAKATDPTSLSSNQQQPSVATFPQRTPGGTPVGNTGSPFGGSFSQAPTSRPTAGFSFNNSTSTNVPAFSFANSSSGNSPAFSFPNQQSGNPPVFQFNQNSNTPFNPNQSSTNPSIQQPIASFTFTPTAQKQDIPNDKTQPPPSSALPTPHNTKQISSPINMSTISKRLSDPPTPTSQQPYSLNQERAEPDAPVPLAEERLLAKKLNTKLRDQNSLVVDRSDPYSPLHSVRSFEDLNLKPDLLKGIYNMGFRSPSRIQEITLPKLMNNPPTNIIAQSQSGTGKTAAFSLTVLSRIDPSIKSPQALILAPTFELAVQIGEVIEKMAQFLPEIKISYAVRDPLISRRANLVRNQLLSEQIVIGTPGTVEEWCLRRRVIDLSSLRMCCVDEADIMINTGDFAQQCVDLVKGLDHSNCQMMLFSATYSDEVMIFARQIVQNPVVLRLKREKQALNNIRQYYIRCYDPQQKYLAIEQIYAYLTVGQAMIFCRTKATARDLAVRMASQQHSVRELTGALDIEQRASIINQFREGLFRVLISTNVLARGIDIDDVTLVINYDMPVTPEFQPDYEAYLHRIGRCGRFGKLGRTFNLIGSENDFGTMQSIEQYFSHPIEEITIEGISHLETDQE